MKLHYFDMPGRGEPIRLLLTHAKIPFEDYRIPFSNWLAVKPTYESLQIPVLEIDGKKYSQSMAILEFLGAKYGYLPLSPCEYYEALCIMNTVDDINVLLLNAYLPYSVYGEEEKKKLRVEIVEEKFPVLFPYLEKKLVDKECKDFLIGSKYSIADFYTLGMHAHMKTMTGSTKLWDGMPGIPLLQAYMKKRLADFANYYKQPCEKPKLYYFDGAGRGEMIRLLLRHAKVDFEDVRIKPQDWPAMKDKFSLKQVPVYECCGNQYPQTDAIMHMLSLKHGYMPLEPEKAFKVSFISGTVKDLFEGFVRVFFTKLPEEKKKKMEEEYFAKTVPIIFAILEKRLLENESHEFFVGRQYTMADFFLLGAAKWLIVSADQGKKYEKQLENSPTLKAYIKKRLEDFP